jgi:hypothetical protein
MKGDMRGRENIKVEKMIEGNGRTGEDIYLLYSSRFGDMSHCRTLDWETVIRACLLHSGDNCCGVVVMQPSMLARATGWQTDTS